MNLWKNKKSHGEAAEAINGDTAKHSAMVCLAWSLIGIFLAGDL
jgi:hypothetical protein